MPLSRASHHPEKGRTSFQDGSPGTRCSTRDSYSTCDSYARALQDIFQEGERVRCMLLGMDEGFSRISLSTADLERQPGDMLFDKVCGGAPRVLLQGLCRALLAAPCGMHGPAPGAVCGACCMVTGQRSAKSHMRGGMDALRMEWHALAADALQGRAGVAQGRIWQGLRPQGGRGDVHCGHDPLITSGVPHRRRCTRRRTRWFRTRCSACSSCTQTTGAPTLAAGCASALRITLSVLAAALRSLSAWGARSSLSSCPMTPARSVLSRLGCSGACIPVWVAFASQLLRAWMYLLIAAACCNPLTQGGGMADGARRQQRGEMVMQVDKLWHRQVNW